MSRRTGPDRLVVLPSTVWMRGRVVLALQITLVAGMVMPSLFQLLVRFLRSVAELPCGSFLSRASLWCRLPDRYPEWRTWLLAVPAIVLIAIALVLIALAARWCLAPLRRAVEPLAAVGPQNLGYRLSAAQRETGADPDLAALAVATDSMIERVAAGYEGQRRFAANASHELRTPLSVQRTLIEVGLAEDVTPDQLRLLTRQLLATNERNERLIEGLLVLAETDQGLQSRTPHRLDSLALAVVAAHGQTASAADVELATEVSPVTVLGEQVLLERLVTNLVQNGIKYNRPGGRVVVRVLDGALEVTNTGDVVPGEAVAGLFEPFHRLRGERIDHSGGAGLGLTIARSIVAAHGGRITATANPPEEGGLTVRAGFPSAADGEAPGQ